MKKTALLFLISFVSTQFARADDLYDGFKNPPNTARPFVQWDWPDKPTEKEINKQLDIMKNAGFGGVEIYSAQNVNAKMLKFAVDAAKQRGMSVDLALGSNLSIPNLQSGEQIQIIALGKKMLKGPSNFKANIKDLIKLADGTQNIPSDPKSRVMFLRLVKMGLPNFDAGGELLDKIQPDGSIAFGLPDNNDYALYIGVRHENFIKPAGANGTLLDPFNKTAVEKYLNNISSNLSPVFNGKLGGSIHAISCDAAQLYGANWTTDFNEQFLQRRGYDITPYLPMILDYNFTMDRTRVYDTLRRTRYDYCLTLAELFHERFVQTFAGFCRDNGVLSRFEPAAYPSLLDVFNDFNLPDIPAGDVPIISSQIARDSNLVAEINSRAINKIASSAAHFAGKSITGCETYISSDQTLESLKTSDDLSFISGVNQSIFNISTKDLARQPFLKNFCDRNARLSHLFQNSRHQARIAILLSFNDLWSDCGPSRSRLADYNNWYLFPLWQALNNNGYAADYINEKILQDATYDDGKLHIGSFTYDCIIIPDAYSIEFPAAKMLRFYAQAGGKIAVIGQPPKTAPGFKDLVERSVPVSITMDYVRQNDPNRVTYVRTPVKDRNILIIWAGELTSFLKISPDVKISPGRGPVQSVNPNLFFVHYLADGRDIFFFTNTDKKAAISFQAQFDTADKTPWLWDPETGNRSLFPYGNSKNLLNINLKSLESILLVFEKTENY